MRYVFSLIIGCYLFNSCGYTPQEKEASVWACECAKDKSIFGIATCIANAADSFNIDASSLGYDRAIKDNCPDTYQRLMDFSKGKKK